MGGDHTSWVVVRVWIPRARWPAGDAMSAVVFHHLDLSGRPVLMPRGHSGSCPRSPHVVGRYRAGKRLGSARRLSRPRTWRDERGRGGREGCTLKLAGVLLTPVGGQQGPDRWQASRAAGDLKLSADLKHHQSMWRLGLHAPNICTRSSGIALPVTRHIVEPPPSHAICSPQVCVLPPRHITWKRNGQFLSDATRFSPGAW